MRFAAMVAFIASTFVLGFVNDAEAQRIRYRVQLTNFGANVLAKCKVKYEERSDRMKFDVEGEDMDTALYTSVDVFLNGVFVQSATVDTFGRFEIDMDSRLGDPVPPVQLLDVVDVFDAVTGDLLFTGEIRTEDGNGGDGQAIRGRMRSRLTNIDANPLARATAKYEARLSRRKFDVEGEDLDPALFTSVDVYINSIYHSTAPVDALGRFDVDTDTTEGDIVPIILEGDIVEVFDTNTGLLLFVGQMRPGADL